MMKEQKNLILAVALAIAILIGFNYFYEQPKQAQLKQQAAVTTQNTSPQAGTQAKPTAQETANAVTPISTTSTQTLSREKALQTSQRISINTPRLHGSINLKGARFDDITLVEYHETTDPKSPEIILLSPENSPQAYFADYGWSDNDKSMATPNKDSIWTTSSTALSVEQPLTLRWENGAGLLFERTIQVDRDYLFTITDKVTNISSAAVSLTPYGQIERFGTPTTGGYFILHEGLLGVLNGKLNEFDYEKIRKKSPIEEKTVGGWLGITDKYWLVALIPDQKTSTQAIFQADTLNGKEVYQTKAVGVTVNIKPGESIESKQNLFAGAKVLSLLDKYEKDLGVAKFDLAVDFGWFYFLTKPLFYVLNFLHQLIGSFGLAILLLTVLVKLLFFPLANKSYRSMSRMKALQPKIAQIQKRYEGDKMRINQEMMELYKKEKINPLAGCLPMLIQAPVFFCLYKVLFVSLEMRHAPFYGWIHDLSAPDPTTIFNLFGLLPWTPPSMLMIGAWPIIMGLTMFIQQKLNPQPTDPAQAKVFMIMPIMLTFLMASFPAGLVIYWSWSNILSMAQQWMIMRMEENRGK